MSSISTPHYLFDQVRRRFTPTLNNIPGMATDGLPLVLRRLEVR
jgi:hypothetical protein